MSDDSPVPLLPAWLEKYLFAEERFALAYEATPPELRALCKQALALQYALFGEAPDFEEQHLRRRAAGFAASWYSQAVPWACVFFDASYASAPRLLAALAPALLARVPLVLAVCVGGQAKEPLLCALELAGQEQSYQLGGPQCVKLLRELARQLGRGRLVLLHGAGQGLGKLRLLALELGLVFWEEACAPLLHLSGEQPGGEELQQAAPAGGTPLADQINMQFLRPAFASADTRHLTLTRQINMPLLRLAHPDALFAGELAGQPVFSTFCPAASLTLLAGMEGAWAHPGLGPDFFRERGLCLGPLANKQSPGGLS